MVEDYLTGQNIISMYLKNLIYLTVCTTSGSWFNSPIMDSMDGIQLIRLVWKMVLGDETFQGPYSQGFFPVTFFPLKSKTEKCFLYSPPLLNKQMLVK